MPYVSFAAAAGWPRWATLVREEARNVVDYLDDTTDADWQFWDFGRLGVAPAEFVDTEHSFIERAMSWLDEHRSLTAEENVLIAHDVAQWGYGQSDTYVTDDGEWTRGALVYADPFSVGSWEVRGMTWHEAGHAYGASHADGDFRVDANGCYTELTPMCWSYLLEPNDGWFWTQEASTTWEGSDEPPERFANGLQNREHQFDDPVHHADRYSRYTREKVANWLDSRED
ncbi:hypothetical protein ACFPYI_06385 [Halomarina salina]|uniref:Metallo-peptidase family M12B Reprolysin-like n=1 Tax=Halomarina salina TaxID=1872699 RepID=A0ABD5RK37_9EURY|nr:hypothetical protein [Halomarina salina]